MARGVLAETPRHVMQRGVDRQAAFFSDAHRRVYLELVQHSAQQFTRLQLRINTYTGRPTGSAAFLAKG